MKKIIPLHHRQGGQHPLTVLRRNAIPILLPIFNSLNSHAWKTKKWNHFASIWKMTKYSLVFPIKFLTSFTALNIKSKYSRMCEIKLRYYFSF